MTTPASLAQRFAALDTLLIKHQHLWRPRPFTQLQLEWEHDHPELANWLRARTLEQAELAHNQPELLDAPAPFGEIAKSAQTLCHVDGVSVAPHTQLNARQTAGIPGRKLQQIEAFAHSLQFAQPVSHWLDWCAGKGHLGRVLAQDPQLLTCLEYDAELVASGQKISDHLKRQVRHIQQDVLAEDCQQKLQPSHTPVALHACGDLHVRLMQLASDAGCQQLAIAPCCYNRTRDEHYQPLSTAAKASSLQLSRDDLGLPASETVTAGARVRRQRDNSMARRLAFDQLQRRLRGINEYLPTPSLPAAWLDKPFADYCKDLAALKDLPAPHADEDWDALQSLGWQRLAEVRNLELVRDLFRRPLEMWLVLDRALYLQEHGYNVTLKRFCPHEVTPRNLLLQAERL
ncbi:MULTISPECIES: methyltransferase [Pseudomonas]|uniref:methyltransferase n=1 Tax=Pseudomonas TaxID=286 RepID=UPI0030024599